MGGKGAGPSYVTVTAHVPNGSTARLSCTSVLSAFSLIRITVVQVKVTSPTPALSCDFKIAGNNCISFAIFSVLSMRSASPGNSFAYFLRSYLSLAVLWFKALLDFFFIRAC